MWISTSLHCLLTLSRTHLRLLKMELLFLSTFGVSYVGIRFFRRVCDDYFRPGLPVPGATCQGFGETGEGDDTQGGVAESKGSGVDAPGDAVHDGKESDMLTEAMMRADYVNSLNVFNQLEVRDLRMQRDTCDLIWCDGFRRSVVVDFSFRML